jgi:hypothetical protein
VRVGAKTAKRWAGSLLALALVLSGCGSLAPYQRPSVGTPLAERQRIYDDKRVALDRWLGLEVGGDTPPLSSWNPYDSLADYYRASGDPADAAVVRKGGPYMLAGMVLDVGGLGAALVLSKNGEILSSGALTAVGLGVLGDLLALYWSSKHYFVPATTGFNAYLHKDLDLPGEAASQLEAPAPESASAQALTSTTGGLYGFVDGGFASLSTADLVDYFRFSGASDASSGWPDDPEMDAQVGLGLGKVLPSGATLEGRVDGLARGNPGRYFTASDGTKTPYRALALGAVDFGIVPGYTFQLWRLSRSRQADIFVGLQVGAGYLVASGIQGDSSKNVQGTYDIRAWGFDGGPLCRLRLPLLRHFSVGLEAGYRLERFPAVDVVAGRGSFNGRSSPDTTLRGTDAAFDFSGPFFNASVLFGSFLSAP